MNKAAQNAILKSAARITHMRRVNKQKRKIEDLSEERLEYILLVREVLFDATAGGTYAASDDMLRRLKDASNGRP
jgi:hypothetical protein